MPADKFAALLTEGIYKIRFAESKNIRLIQDELGYALGKQGGTSIEYWRKGQIPARLSDVEKLAREIVKRAHLERAWLEKFLQSADHPAPEKLCDELFPPISPVEIPAEQAPIPPLHPAEIPMDAPADAEAVEVERNIFVAREGELGQLNRFLDDVLALKRGRVVFVTGEAGSGKTALVEEFTWHVLAAHASLVVAGGECNAYTSVGDPYLPFREVLGLLTGDRETRWAAKAHFRKQAHRLQISLPHAAQALVTAGPNLIDTFIPGSALLARVENVGSGEVGWPAQLKALVAREAAASGPTGPEQHSLFEQYTKVLRALARRGPLVLVLDDLQWADKGSINLLFHLGKRIEGSPILIVGIYRLVDVAVGRDGERHPLDPVVNELQRHFGSIRIDLRQGMDQQFVEAMLDTEPNRLGVAFREALYRHTRGHALFTIEMLGSMRKRGDLVRDEMSGEWMEGPTLDWETLPARVEGVIEERIERLPVRLQETLKVASVEGENFLAEVVARVQADDEWMTVRQLSNVLDQQHRLIRSEISQRLGAQRLSHYRFRHILFQQYLYNSLDPVEKVFLHEVVGNALEQLYTGQTEEVAVQLARHFQAAGLVAKAVEYLRQVGEKAVRLSANVEAIAHFSQALALLQNLPDTPERRRQELALQTSLGPALIPIKGYAAPEVEQAYARARELCRQAGDSPQVYQMLLGLWLYYLVRAELLKAHELGEQLLQLARRVQDPVIFLHAHRALGNTSIVKGDFTSAQDHFDQAFGLYGSLQHRSRDALLYGHDPGVTCLAFSSLALWLFGYPDQALNRSSQALILAEALDHPFNVAFAHSLAALLHHLRRERQAAQEHAEAAFRLSTEKGFTQWLAHNTLLRGWALTQSEKTDNEILKMRGALDAWQATGARLARPYFLLLLAESYGIVGQAEAGLALLSEALTVAHDSGERWPEAELYRLQGELWLMQGEAEPKIEAYFRQAIEVARRQDARSLELRAVMSLSRLWQRQGKPDEARPILAEIYASFTEGFDTLDLIEARELLAQAS